MFFDQATSTAFGSLGWIDGAALWSFDTLNGLERRFAVEGARYVSVCEHAPGLIRLYHQGEGVVSIRACSRPDAVLASLHATPSGYRFVGDSALWGDNLALLITADSSHPDLVLIDGSTEQVRSLDLGWFNANTFELGYQGLVDCLAMPDAGLVVVGVQRSSDLVLIDMEGGSRVGSISLANRGGNPRLLKLTDSLLAASDYDVICLVDIDRRMAIASDVLQPVAPQMTAQFIGDYAFGSGALVVARPFSGDVIRLDPTSLTILGRATVEGQPLSLCMTSDHAFLTRDWKTGVVCEGTFGR